jgi:nitronate monooxygenase
VAAGGIADGRGLAAVLALGADAAWLGTRFVACDEAPFAPGFKDRVLAAAETETIYTTLFDVGWPGAPHRVLRNSTVRRWEEAGRPEPGRRPGEGETIAIGSDGEAYPRYSFMDPALDMTGDVEGLAHYAGQSAGTIASIRPAAAIVREIVDQAESVLRDLAGAPRGVGGTSA